MLYIDSRKGRWGVEPICKALQFAPSTYYAKKRGPSARSLSDEKMIVEIKRVHAESRQRYGADKVWRQLLLDGFNVARCTVEGLMRQEGLKGVRRGGSWKPRLVMTHWSGQRTSSITISPRLGRTVSGWRTWPM